MPLVRVLHAAPRRGGAARGEDASLRERLAEAAGGAPGSAGARAAHASLQKERPTLSHLLACTGCTPALGALLDALPPLAPRFYSIANADTARGGGAAAGGGGEASSRRLIHLCLSVVQYYTSTPSGGRVARRGLASNMLADLAAPLLDAAARPKGGAPPPAVSVEVFKREPGGYELRLPKDPMTPIAMVGPGTGLAPFRGFIQHRRYAYQRRQLGPSHLFFGCRSHDDFLYGDELTALGGSGALALHTAFSREGEPQAAGHWRGARINIPYVQDAIEEHGAALCELLFRKGGHVYVCGDGQSMAKDVHDALKRAAMVGERLSEEAAEKALAKLSEEGRYQREIWN